MTCKFVKIDDWVKDILVDSLGKEKLKESEDGKFLLTDYGRKYPIVNGIYDLRLLNNETTNDQKIWKSGQDGFENITETEINSNVDYETELNGVKDVYREIPIEGTCLDVGGHQGRLRAFLEPKQKYISCDPFLNVFEHIEGNEKLLKYFPFLKEPVNFIACDAEFLPFRSCSFDTVHMRSVIDHFLNPELALNEAYRVLKHKGVLVVGLTVHGGKKGKESLKDILKETIKRILPYLGITKYVDHHIWHPTYKELQNLITDCGFSIEKVYWQKNCNDKVCYIKAVKKAELSRK